MPKYFYKCTNSDCAKIFEIIHSMKEKLQSCDQCAEDCKKNSPVERIPATSISISKQVSSSQDTKPGKLVKKNIEEFRKALKEEQQRLKNVEYK
jgi:hypothetical protein